MKREDYIKSIFELENKIKRLRFFSELGVASPMEIGILSVIVEHKGRCVVTEIAKELNTTMPNVSRALKSMEKKEMIVRNVDTLDRRNTFVCLTEHGEKYFEGNMLVVSKFMSSALSRLDTDDLKTYSILLTKIFMAYNKELANMKNN